MAASNPENVYRSSRLEKKISVRKAAAAADMDQGVLSKIENGLRLPTEEQVQRLATVYAMDPAPWLAERAVSEIQKKYGDKDYFSDCVRMLQEGSGTYGKCE